MAQKASNWRSLRLVSLTKSTKFDHSFSTLLLILKALLAEMCQLGDEIFYLINLPFLVPSKARTFIDIDSEFRLAKRAH
jgi:hypothetical protein